jgi:hypothetical protein
MESDEIMLNKIRQLTELQRELLLGFKKAYPWVKDYENMFDVPKHGNLIVIGQDWQFTKHGVGLKFERLVDGLLVDMHKYFDKPELFDASRVKHFLYSYSIRPTEREIFQGLSKLVERGKLVEEKEFNQHFSLS